MTALLAGQTYLLPLIEPVDINRRSTAALRDKTRDIAYFVFNNGGTLCFTHTPWAAPLLNAARKQCGAKSEQLIMVSNNAQSAQDLLEFGAADERTIVACAVIVENDETIECVRQMKQQLPQLRVLPFLSRPRTRMNIPSNLADPSFIKMWERNWRLPTNIQLEMYTASMYRVIRCYENYEVAILASPPNAGPDTDGATFFRFADWHIGEHEPFKLNPISARTALGYFSGHADAGGWGERPGYYFTTQEEALTFLTEQHKLGRKRIREKLDRLRAESR